MAVSYIDVSGSLTLFQAVYEAVRRTGYIKNKVDFARLIGMHEGNVYSYLADMDKPYRLRMSPDSLQGYCWQIGQATGLSIQLTLFPDLTITVEVTGTDYVGQSFPPFRFRTTYHIPWIGVRPNEPYSCDFQAPSPLLRQWEEEWEIVVHDDTHSEV